MLRKLAVTLVATTVSDPYLQVLWALLILVISFGATAYFAPYEVLLEHLLPGGDEQGEAEFRAALGTRPPLPADVNGAGEIYRLPLQLHLACTQHEPRQRPSARQVARQLVNENECH